MSKNDGPRVTISASCFDCAHEESESYAVQGDSGCKVYCAHPSVVAESALRSRRRVGDTTWATPAWCPLLAPAIDKLIKERNPS